MADPPNSLLTAQIPLFFRSLLGVQNPQKEVMEVSLQHSYKNKREGKKRTNLNL